MVDAQQVYRVVRESDVQTRFELAATQGLTPLVGRESETKLLFERWEQVKEGQGQVVLLSGEAGIGKSRLLQVLRDHVSNEPHMRLECRSSPYYQNTSLYPITDLLQRALRWQQDDTLEQRLAKLEQELSQYRLPLEDFVPLFASFLSLPIPEGRYPPFNMSPQRQRQKTLESIVAILLEQAEQRPVLFVLEDLHWLDPTSLELLDLLLDQTPTTSILTILTCRPTFQPPWSSRSYLTQITLGRLSRSQIERMAERVAGGKRLPSEVLHQIVEKTDGVPLFVEEMTKAVMESGHIKEAEGHYELLGPVTSLTIPNTLQDSLMSRLDRLVSAKGIAQLAAVIGRQFGYTLLQTISQLDDVTLQRELGRLVDAELVYQQGLVPRASFTFKHALIQDAAYQSLLQRTRQAYHQRIAQTLSTQFPEVGRTQPELLAHHYTEAGLSAQAITYWQQAGQLAIQRSANPEAIGHLTRGLEVLKLLPDTHMRAEAELTLQTTLGVPLLATKGFGSPEVENVYARARELCQQVGATPQLFSVLWGIWWVYEHRSALRTARELAAQLLTLAQQQQEPALLMQAHRAMGQTMYWLGELNRSRTHLEQGITLYDPQEHRSSAFLYGQDPGVGLRNFAALVLWSLGYPEQAVGRINEALALAHAVSHPFSLAFAQSFVTWHHHYRREVAVTQAQAEVAMALCREQGFAFFLAQQIVLRGWALADQGQVEEGIAQMRQGLTAYKEVFGLQATGAEGERPYLLALLAEAYGKMGQTGEGLRVLDETLGATQRYVVWDGELHRIKGELLLTEATMKPNGLMTSSTAPTVPEAEACFQTAITIAQNQSAKSWELRAATSLARLWQSQGKRQEAHELLAPVYGWFTEGFDTADLQEAKALLQALEG